MPALASRTNPVVKAAAFPQFPGERRPPPGKTPGVFFFQNPNLRSDKTLLSF